MTEVAAYRDRAFDLAHRVTARRSDRPVALKPGGSLRFETRWDHGLAGDLRLVPAEGPMAIEFQARGAHSQHMFDDRTPVEFQLEFVTHGNSAVAGALEIEVIDAVEGTISKERRPLKMNPDKPRT